MRTLLLAGAAALTLATFPAMAQDTNTDMTATASTSAMTSDQQAAHDSWPADQQAAYDAWPVEVQTYYWTLTPSQQKGWWVLTDGQRTKIVSLTPAQQQAAWNAIEAQMGARATAATDTMSASTAASTSGNMQFVKSEVVQPTPANSSANSSAMESGDLPICKKGQQDGCINGWQKGHKGTKPLDYWPGKPASDTTPGD
ncbi:hypothetical protein GRI58_09630 [Porphyrobacter algicida]|uniref:Uncharacterized protein n=1 Tax=Qipengyuania algicida TaxID=1836209 RepID=A0A845AEY6_9SPHN|nr:hypothetical protein [Qipengyuania algicida]MXP29082.1 hypothetical protein [Qipengyuania algicida]